MAVPDLLAVEEHRRLVLLTLADHDDATHRDRVQHQPHGVDGRLVGAVLVAAPDPATRSHRSRLRHADELEREIPVGRLAHAGNPYIRSGASTPTSPRDEAITVCVARQRPSRNA